MYPTGLWAALALLLLCIPSRAHAQEGAFVGIKGGWTHFTFDEDITFSEDHRNASGPGLGLYFGYVFNETLTLMVDVSGYSLNSGEAVKGNALVRARFRFLERPLSPYADIDAGGTVIRFDDLDAQFTGQHVGLGLGLDFRVNNQISLSLGANAHRIWINKRRIGNFVEKIETLKSIQLQPFFGVAFHF